MIKRIDNPLVTDLKHILNHTTNLWEELREKKIFLTGGTGFFGCWFLESFHYINEILRLNASVTVLTRSVDNITRKVPHLVPGYSITFIEGDIHSFKFPTEKYDFIIHAATESDRSLNPTSILSGIINGTTRMLDFATVTSCKKFLFTSSGAVYGKQYGKNVRILEETPSLIDAETKNAAYAEGKRASEILCCLYAKEFGFESKIARCFAFVGPYLPLDSDYAIGNFILNRIKSETITIKGNGTPLRSYLYASDLMIWLWTILFKGKNCASYNVGSDKSVSIRELGALIGEMSMPMLDQQILSKDSHAGEPENYVPNVDKIRRELGVSENISLNEAIVKVLDFYKRKPHSSNILK